jgi:hypothetical protein
MHTFYFSDSIPHQSAELFCSGFGKTFLMKKLIFNEITQNYQSSFKYSNLP